MERRTPRPAKAITRPGVLHLPLADQHTFTSYGDDPKNKLLSNVPSSRWSMTSEPKSSASTYSQGSWSNSPVFFSEARVDRRRFAIAISPSQDGPWKRSFPSADGSVSAVEIPQIQPESTMPLVKNQLKEKDVEGKKKKTRSTRTKRTPTILSTAPPSESRSTGMLGKMFPRRLTRPPRSARVALEPVIIIEREQPRLPLVPPQVFVTLPSPELNITDDLVRLGDGNDSKDVTVESKVIPSTPIELQFTAINPGHTLPTSNPEDSRSLVLDHEQPIQSLDLSIWKPKRPPSPVPPHMRRKSKLKHIPKTITSHFSLPPPVPVLAQYDTLVFPRSPRAAFSIPLSPPPPHQIHSLLRPMQSHVPDDEMTLQMYLKARASKSATYALHDGGIFSPTSNIH